MPFNPERGATFSIGGSVLVPDCEYNVTYILDLVPFLQDYLSNYSPKLPLVFVTGGGDVSRQKQLALIKGGVTDPDILDRAGIGPTRQNAQLVADVLFANHIDAEYVHSPRVKFPKANVLIGGGTNIRQTTDAPTVTYAHHLGFKQVVNITSVGAVYPLDAQRKLDFSQEPYKILKNREYLNIVGPDHTPGEQIPAGRTAIKLAGRYKIDFYVVGPDFNNLKNLLLGNEYFGTLLYP